MLDQMFGDFQKKQEEMTKKLSTIIVESDFQDGAIKISANANKQISNIAIDHEKIDVTDKEQLEDCLVVAINEALALAEAKQQEQSQSLLNDMLPGGLSNLFGS